MESIDIDLNRWMDEQDRLESPAETSKANARLERKRTMVGTYASLLLSGSPLQVGSRIADRNQIIGECLHDPRIKPAMRTWRETGDKLPILDVIHRAASLLCANVLGWDLVELGLITNRFAKMPTREECESYEMPLQALIDSHLKRPVGTAVAILQAEINGEIEEFMARGHTMLEADTKAQRLRQTALAKAAS